VAPQLQWLALAYSCKQTKRCRRHMIRFDLDLVSATSPRHLACALTDLHIRCSSGRADHCCHCVLYAVCHKKYQGISADRGIAGVQVRPSCG
jgi:hypothetical protein